MNNSTVLLNATFTRLPNIAAALGQSWAARWRALIDSAKQPRDAAAALYARAASYEATQPGFAADLRAAADALDRSATIQAR
jgi:hypothetical protein